MHASPKPSRRANRLAASHRADVRVGAVGVGKKHQVRPTLPDFTDRLLVPTGRYFQLDPSIALPDVASTSSNRSASELCKPTATPR